MSDTDIKDWDVTASLNGTVQGINIAEGAQTAQMNNALRAVISSVARSDFGVRAPKMDLIAESTANAGVTIDGVLIKDGDIPSISAQLTNNAKTNQAQQWTAPQHFGANAITSSAGTLALDFASSQVATVTLSENVTTITIANVTANSVVEVWFRQDAATARTVTGWPGTVDWFIEGSEPAVPATLDAFFVVSLRYDGTSYRASIAPS